IDPYQKLSGYYESDFLGVGQTSNYNQSNSWAPRLRHAYFTYDNTGWGGWGFHILAGQTWTLATQNQVDMTPRKENIPLTIDANYVVGFNYLRQWQIRGVVDVAPGIALGVSAENPAARRRVRQRRHRQWPSSQFRQYRGRGRLLAKRERHD